MSRRTVRKASGAIAAPLRARRSGNREDIIMREKVSDVRRGQQVKLRGKRKTDRISDYMIPEDTILRVSRIKSFGKPVESPGPHNSQSEFSLSDLDGTCG